jgi:hypothetical protein
MATDINLNFLQIRTFNIVRTTWLCFVNRKLLNILSLLIYYLVDFFLIIIV